MAFNGKSMAFQITVARPFLIIDNPTPHTPLYLKYLQHHNSFWGEIDPDLLGKSR